MNMGAFPSGQWGQTVNLLLNASVVRIHQLPPKGCDKNVVTAFFLCYIAENRRLRRPILKARFTVLSNRFLTVGLFYLRILTACPLPCGLIFNFFQENFRFSLLFSEYFQFPRSQFLNSTPFVRQYDILSNKWGVLLCQKEYQTNDIRRSSRKWL